MRTINRTIWLFYLMSAFFVQTIQGQSVFDVIASNPQLQRFEEAMISSGTVNLLQPTAAYTVFAPTNSVMETLPATLLQNPAALQDFLLTHITNGFFRSDELIDGYVMSSLNNRNIVVSRTGDDISVVGANVIERDLINNSNGVVHIIDNLILKQNTTETTVWSIIQNSENHTILETIILEAECRSEYRDQSFYTVFAPTDEAFLALRQSQLDMLLGDNLSFIKNILDFHRYDGDLDVITVASDSMVIAVNGQELMITRTFNPAQTFVNGARIQFSELPAANGKVYVIEKVMIPEPLPPFSIWDFVEESEDHTVLEQLVQAGALDDDLDAPGQFTFFAPTDDVLANLDADFINDLLNDPVMLDTLLRNHLVGGSFDVEELDDIEMITSVNGYELSFDRVSGTYTVNDANIIVEDILTDNGIVHVIDMLLFEMPERVTVYDIIAFQDSLTEFHDFVIDADFRDTLRGDGPFTVFAPGNSAISNLLRKFIDDLNSPDSELLDTFIRSHIVADDLPSGELTIDSDFSALNNHLLLVDVDTSGIIRINGSQLVVRDLIADNGVVHIIEEVFVPRDSFFSIYDFLKESVDHVFVSSLIDSAGIQSVYDNRGQLTFFAPTDRAFENLPLSLFDQLVLNEDGAFVDQMLRHTITATLTVGDLLINGQANSASNELLEFPLINGRVFVNNVELKIQDIIVDNGIVHVVDALILTEDEVRNTVFDVIANSPDHTQLESVLESTNLDDALISDNNITFFAPTDSAFDDLPTDVLDGLLNDLNALTDALLYHRHNNLLLSASMTDGLNILMGNGNNATINVDGSSSVITINGVILDVTDIVADNGVVHVINSVLIAEELQNLYEVISEDSELSTFKSAIDQAGLVNKISVDNPITVFAPTNQAFDNLPAGVLSALLSGTATELQNVILSHVFDGSLASSSITQNLTIASSNGETLNFQISGGNVFINNIQIVVTDIQGANGILHKIDGVIMPEEELFTIYDAVSQNSSLTILKNAIDQSGLDQTLQTQNGLTLFAPSNDAFGLIPSQELADLLADPLGELRTLLLKHVHGQALQTSSFLNGLVLSMQDGSTVTVTQSNNDIFINGSRISVRDIVADNGVVHIIEMVISDEPDLFSVYDIISSREDLRLLKTYIDVAGLNATLNGVGQFTVFAPTDNAFNSISQSIIADLLADPQGALRPFLLRHVYDEGEIFANNFANGTMIEMGNGEQVRVSVNGNDIYINNSRITISNLDADNGVVHIVDAVILDQDQVNSVFDVIEESENHTILEDLLIRANLETLLRTSAVITVFAPDDAAFNQLGQTRLTELQTMPIANLSSILLGHATSQEIPSIDFFDGLNIFMATGQTETMTLNGSFFIRNSRIIQTDIFADNGVVHVVDKLVSEGTTSTFDILESDVKISPNPTYDVLNIEIETDKINDLQVLDPLGRTVLSKSVNSSKESIDVSQLPQGMYFLRMAKGLIQIPFMKM